MAPREAGPKQVRDPMGDGQNAPTMDILDRCESDFERGFAKRLIELEYRIRPQVPVGGRRIDLVVEGADDRRRGGGCHLTLLGSVAGLRGWGGPSRLLGPLR